MLSKGYIFLNQISKLNMLIDSYTDTVIGGRSWNMSMRHNCWMLIY